MIIKKKSVYIFLLISIALTACLNDVTHDNPLDPKSHNRGFSITGQVHTFYAPFRPVPNAVISLLPGEKKSFSSSEGSFSITGLTPGTYTVFCRADGFGADSLAIDLSKDQKIAFHLDGLPFFEKIALTTHHVLRFFPVEDQFYLQVDTRVNDPDGIADIKRVSFEIPDFSAMDTLAPSLNAGEFSNRLSIENLPVNTIHSLIGRDFILSIEDDPGQIVKSGDQYLTRVIDASPVVTSPTNLQVVPNDSITFKWEKLRLPYWYEHKIEIFQINLGLLTRVKEINNIPASAISQKTKNDLPTGDYVWILSVSDEFGNSSSGKEGTFHISK